MYLEKVIEVKRGRKKGRSEKPQWKVWNKKV